MKQYTVAFTHTGKFHADDVFSAAFLKGLDNAAIKRIEKTLVEPLDAADNGGEQNLLSVSVAMFNPPWTKEDLVDAYFSEAVAWAGNLLSHCIERENAQKEANEIITKARDAMEREVVVLERFVPFAEVLSGSDAKFVIYPSMRKTGEYQMQGVPFCAESKAVKQKFPDAWCGCSEEDLPRISGYDGLLFCHKNGFLISCRDLETARQIGYDMTGSDAKNNGVPISK